MSMFSVIKAAIGNTKNGIRRYLLKCDYWVAGKCYYIFRLLPLQNKVVATNFRGRRYGDNPKFIVEELHAINPDADIVWLQNRHFTYELPPYVRPVSFYHHISKAYELATAKVWINSHRMEDNIRKRKGQIFIETWHGGLGIKKIEGDVDGDFLSEKDQRELENTVRLADLFISNSDHLSRIYRSAFGYKGPIWKCGYPKNDIMFSDKVPYRRKIRAEFGLPEDTNLLIYAPTFRDSFETEGFDKTPYDIDFAALHEALKLRFGGDWKILLRWHPTMAAKMEDNKFGICEYVIDATSYPDMQELIIAADALITDYSSCIFDAAMIGLPCFTFATDFEEYSRDRGTYYTMEDLPFPYAVNNEELIRNVMNYDETDRVRRWADFEALTGLRETGHAGKDIAGLIHRYLTENKLILDGISGIDRNTSADVSRNVVLLGLPYDNNLGDQAIFECAAGMLREVLDKYDLKDIEIRRVDMTGRTGIEENPLKKEFLKKYSFRIPRRICWLLHADGMLKKLKLREAGFVSRRLCRQYVDSNTAAIIFAGGGIVKYKYQMFHRYIDAVTAFADKKKCPVFLNAVGVEGFDANDPECRILRRALNRSCVKYISTRDDLRTLNEKYIKGSQVTKRVADPACSMSRFMPKTPLHHNIPVIGLGVVREGLFIDNGINMNKQSMLEFWSQMYDEIEKRGYICRLFGNGALSDDKFLQDLLDYMNIPEDRRAVVALKRPESVGMLTDMICSFDALITGRLHASILAYSYGVPSVGLVWNDKQKMFGKATGHPERFVTYENFEAGHIIDLIETAATQGYPEDERSTYCSSTSRFIEKFVRRYLCDPT